MLNWKSGLVLGSICLIVWGYYQSHQCDCKKRVSYENVLLNKAIILDSLYLPIKETEIESIKANWNDYPLDSDSFHIISQFKYAVGRELQLIAHFYNGAKHYGILIQPTNYDPQKTYPTVVWVNGLNQADPSVHLQNGIIKNLIGKLSNHFIIIPSYRGQALVLNNKRYCSDGFFGDAFDGATDDALRLLALAKKQKKGMDTTQITAFGLSRGGTVALLMGSRDTTIKNVVAIAGPSDFYSKKAYHRYGQQYKYQFLSTTTDKQAIREKMIKSSPVYFIDRFPNNLLLIHGENDPIVNVDHAKKVIAIMKNQPNFESSFTNTGHDFYDWNKVFEWIKERSY